MPTAITKLEDVYLQHVHAVRRFARTVAPSREEAEDLTSEAFLALHRNFTAIDEALLPAWLLTVVRNRARDLWRRAAVERRYAEQCGDLEVVVDSPTSEVSLLACRDLKPVHRRCLTLRYRYGMTRAEIAAATGLTDMQVKGHLQYGLALLRKVCGAMADDRADA